ncbi:MAG TPA: histidine kinase [Bryobacteraceae bacterium]|nr:histidine kinase [Bryobacteraceae bacterium]
MHPLLASSRRLIAYLLAWAPIVALLAWLAPETPGAAWAGFASVLAPVCVLYAFVCLSPWPICRAWPLDSPNREGLAATWIGAAVVAGLILMGAAALAEYFLHPAVRLRLPLLFAMGTLLYLFSAGLHYAALAARESREAEQRAAEARTLAREAELQALRIQINPHFLFNCLHSIAALATMDGPRAREMCIRLADFLRNSLRLGECETIPLKEELALARNYLEVEQVRFGSRLTVEERIEPGCEDCGVPALLLQPLVENAVKHGVAGLVEGGAIRLEARRRGDGVAILLENAFDPESETSRSLGLGLRNVRRRLSVRYGDEAEMEAGPTGDRYRVSLRLPCESPMASSSRA